MHIKVTKEIFRMEFRRMGRGEQFSYDALGALYDFLNEMDGDAELDVIAICCDWTEMTEDAIYNEYGLTVGALKEDTTVLKVRSGRYLVAAF